MAGLDVIPSVVVALQSNTEAILANAAALRHNAWTPAAIIASISSIAALVSAYLSLQSLRFNRVTNEASRRATLEGQLRQHLVVYLKEYADLQKDNPDVPDPWSIDGYGDLPPAQKRRAEIVTGLLIGVVDLMNETDHPFKDRWSTFIGLMPGVIRGHPEIHVFARRPDTLEAIEAARSGSSTVIARSTAAANAKGPTSRSAPGLQ